MQKCLTRNASRLPAPIIPDAPATSLAPMRDVTNLPFMKVVAGYGAPDYFFTEYFRVHPHSTLEKRILDSIVKNETGRPVFAQIIGNSVDRLRMAAIELAAYPVAGIDLNIGCPAPKVYKKRVGGGLLRDLDKLNSIFGALRDAISGLFTVKMRIGFETADNFGAVLDLVNKHGIDLLSVHGRTVKEGYRGKVHYDRIAQAVATARCPVQANGDITSAEKAVEVQKITGCFGLMIGRSAIRNPWIFRQARERFSGSRVFSPRLADVRAYVDHLYRATRTDGIPERTHVSRIKKFLNFVGQGVDPEGRFLHEMRRARTEAELFAVCDRHLIDGSTGERLFPTEPYAGVIARPNCEAPISAE